jgi:hypothetical protein
VTVAPDGRYHMLASSWPMSLPFMAGYPICSRVIRAEAAGPAGPFTFRQVVLPDRGPDFWDGRATHNPQIHRVGDTWALFYIGTTFAGDRPATRAALSETGDLIERAYSRFRIGCATAPDPRGPWTRLDAPVLDVRPGKWDSTITTNPAVCVCRDGWLLMLYRSNTPGGCRLGAARAPRLGEPFERISDEPILADLAIEDPFVWQNAEGVYEMVAKDLSGRITGEFHAGVHAISDDGARWRLAGEPKAWSRTLRFADGTSRTFGHLERPYVLMGPSGEPVMLYLATAIPEGPFKKIDARLHDTWITAIPLEG